MDTSGEKFENSPGLKRWAAIENLKIAAASYNEVGSISELERKISVQTQAGKSAKQSVVEIEHRLKDLGEIIKICRAVSGQSLLSYRLQKSQKSGRIFPQI